jgi:CCR4-NOT transcriptional regulation complex NOT5 subunit
LEGWEKTHVAAELTNTCDRTISVEFNTADGKKRFAQILPGAKSISACPDAECGSYIGYEVLCSDAGGGHKPSQSSNPAQISQASKTSKPDPLPKSSVPSVVVSPTIKMPDATEQLREKISACVKNDESGLGVPPTCDVSFGSTYAALCGIQQAALQKWCGNRHNGLPQADLYGEMATRQKYLNQIQVQQKPKVEQRTQKSATESQPQFSISPQAMARAKSQRCTEYDYDALKQGLYAKGPLWEAGSDGVAYSMSCSPIRNLEFNCEARSSDLDPQRPPGKLHKENGQSFCVRK